MNGVITTTTPRSCNAKHNMLTVMPRLALPEFVDEWRRSLHTGWARARRGLLLVSRWLLLGAWYATQIAAVLLFSATVSLCVYVAVYLVAVPQSQYSFVALFEMRRGPSQALHSASLYSELGGSPLAFSPPPATAPLSEGSSGHPDDAWDATIAHESLPGTRRTHDSAVQQWAEATVDVVNADAALAARTTAGEIWEAAESWWRTHPAPGTSAAAKAAALLRDSRRRRSAAAAAASHTRAGEDQWLAGVFAHPRRGRAASLLRPGQSYEVTVTLDIPDTHSNRNIIRDALGGDAGVDVRRRDSSRSSHAHVSDVDDDDDEYDLYEDDDDAVDAEAESEDIAVSFRRSRGTNRGKRRTWQQQEHCMPLNRRKHDSSPRSSGSGSSSTAYHRPSAQLAIEIDMLTRVPDVPVPSSKNSIREGLLVGAVWPVLTAPLRALVYALAATWRACAARVSRADGHSHIADTTDGSAFVSSNGYVYSSRTSDSLEQHCLAADDGTDTTGCGDGRDVDDGDSVGGGGHLRDRGGDGAATGAAACAPHPVRQRKQPQQQQQQRYSLVSTSEEAPAAAADDPLFATQLGLNPSGHTVLARCRRPLLLQPAPRSTSSGRGRRRGGPDGIDYERSSDDTDYDDDVAPRRRGLISGLVHRVARAVAAGTAALLGGSGTRIVISDYDDYRQHRTHSSSDAAAAAGARTSTLSVTCFRGWVESPAHPLSGFRLRVEPPGLLVAPHGVVTVTAVMTGVTGAMARAPLLIGVIAVSAMFGCISSLCLCACCGVHAWAGGGIGVGIPPPPALRLWVKHQLQRRLDARDEDDGIRDSMSPAGGGGRGGIYTSSSGGGRIRGSNGGSLLGGRLQQQRQQLQPRGRQAIMPAAAVSATPVSRHSASSASESTRTQPSVYNFNSRSSSGSTSAPPLPRTAAATRATASSSSNGGAFDGQVGSSSSSSPRSVASSVASSSGGSSRDGRVYDKWLSAAGINALRHRHRGSAGATLSAAPMQQRPLLMQREQELSLKRASATTSSSQQQLQHRDVTTSLPATATAATPSYAAHTELHHHRSRESRGHPELLHHQRSLREAEGQPGPPEITPSSACGGSTSTSGAALHDSNQTQLSQLSPAGRAATGASLHSHSHTRRALSNKSTTPLAPVVRNTYDAAAALGIGARDDADDDDATATAFVERDDRSGCPASLPASPIDDDEVVE